jgi:hypothetical protein
MTDNASDQQSQCDQRPAWHSPTRPAAFLCSPFEVEHLLRLRIFCEVAHSNLRSRAGNDTSAHYGRRHAFRVVALLAPRLPFRRPFAAYRAPAIAKSDDFAQARYSVAKTPRRPALWELCDAGDGCCDPGRIAPPCTTDPGRRPNRSLGKVLLNIYENEKPAAGNGGG